MSIEAIELLSAKDRRAYADKLALELLRPVPAWEWPRQTRSIGTPAEPEATQTRRPRPRPSLSRIAVIERATGEPVTVVAGPQSAPIRPLPRPKPSGMAFVRRAFDAVAAVDRAGEAL